MPILDISKMKGYKPKTAEAPKEESKPQEKTEEQKPAQETPKQEEKPTQETQAPKEQQEEKPSQTPEAKDPPDELPPVGKEGKKIQGLENKEKISLFHPKGKANEEDKPSDGPKKEEKPAQEIKEETKATQEPKVAETPKEEKSNQPEVKEEPIKKEPPKQEAKPVEQKPEQEKTSEDDDEPEQETLSRSSEQKLIVEDNILELYARGYNEKEIEHFTGAKYEKILNILAKNLGFILKIKHFLNKHYGGFNFALGLVAVISVLIIFVSIPTMWFFYEQKIITETNTEAILDSQFYYGQGIAFYNNDDFKEAIVQFNKAYETQPKNTDILYYIGDAYMKMEDFELAESTFSQIISIDSKDKRAYVQKALALNQLERYGEALEEINKALKIDKNYNMAHYYSCPLLEKLGRLEESKDCYFAYGNFEDSLKIKNEKGSESSDNISSNDTQSTTE
jgi:tetratricopeptide (TPR) repeat protein